MALVVNASELLTEIQFRQAWAAGEVERRHVRLNALPGDSPERGKLHAEISVYTAIGAEMQSLLEMARGRVGTALAGNDDLRNESRKARTGPRC